MGGGADGREAPRVIYSALGSHNSINKEESGMKLIRWFGPAFLLLAGVATAQDVRYNYDKSADFTKYKTYKWVEMKTSDKDADGRQSDQVSD